MKLKLFSPSSSFFLAAGDGDGRIYAQSLNGFYTVDLVNGAQSLILSGASAISAQSCAVIGASTLFTDNNSANQQLVQNETGFTQAYAGNSGAPLGRGQGSAFNVTAGEVMSCSISAGKVLYITTGFAAGELTVAGMGTIATCICANAEDSTFFVGSREAKVYEVDGGANVVNTINLPTTPNAGTTPNLVVSNIVRSQGQILVSTTEGAVFHYDETLTLKNRYYFGGYGYSNNIGGVFMSVSNTTGMGILVHQQGSSNSRICVNTMNLSASGLRIEDSFVISFSNGTIGALDCGYDESVNRAWLMGGNGLIILELPDYSVKSIETAIKEGGVSVAGRILRIRVFGDRSEVVRDSNIAATNVSLDDTGGASYYEIATTGSGPSRKVDWRRFFV